MTSLLMSSLMRSSPSGNLLVNHLASSQALACRAKIGFDNLGMRSKKYRGAARERRKQAKRDKMASLSALKDSNLERPPFLIPQRFKLLLSVMQDHKNAHRLGRKPMPQELKDQMAHQLKEYNEFKTAEKTLIDLERGKMLQVQMKALDAIVFLPDYLI